jgi:hypothetical protein
MAFILAVCSTPPPVYSPLIEPFPARFNARVEQRLQLSPYNRVKRDGISNVDFYEKIAPEMLASSDSEHGKFIQV